MSSSSDSSFFSSFLAAESKKVSFKNNKAQVILTDLVEKANMLLSYD